MDCSEFQRIAQLYELSNTVHACCGITCTEISNDGVHGVDPQGNRVFYPADTVIIAVGMRSRKETAEAFRGCAKEFYSIGDCSQVRKIMNAVWDAHCAAESLSYSTQAFTR